jgi:hypothetical protein
MIGWKPKSSDTRVASTRIRCLNPLHELQRRGFPVEIFRPEHVSQYTAVVYSKLYDEASYREAAGLRDRGTRIVVDLCDNHFYNPTGKPELARARVALERMLRLADYLVASTPELGSVIRAELGTDRPVEVIGDAVEETIAGDHESGLRRWLRRRELQRLLAWLENGRTMGIEAALVWFGIHGGPHHEHGIGDLLRVRPLIEQLHQRHRVQLTVISNSRQKFDRLIAPWSVPTHYLEWSPLTFLPALRAHQIALIPVTQNPFTWCKSNNRLATAIAAGLGVVADTIPSYQEFAQVCRLDDWEKGLSDYVRDPAIRSRDVQAGQTLVSRFCSPERIADAWQRLFTTVTAESAKAVQLEASPG